MMLHGATLIGLLIGVLVVGWAGWDRDRKLRERDAWRRLPPQVRAAIARHDRAERLKRLAVHD